MRGALEAGREEGSELHVGAGVGGRDGGVDAPRARSDVHHHVVHLVVAIEVVVVEEVAGL